MTGEITAAAIVAERPDLQPTGEAYCELALTGATLADVPPHHRLEVARFLQTLLNRPPLAGSTAYQAHREILGALIVDLEALTVRDALDGAETAAADLRDPAVVARERELISATRDWAAGRRAETATAYDEHVDRILAGNDADHAAAATSLDAAVERAQDAPDASVWV